MPVRLGLAFLVAGLAIASAGCGGEQEADVAPAPPPVGADGAFSGTTLDGRTVRSTEFRGKPLFVNVWSSW